MALPVKLYLAGGYSPPGWAVSSLQNERKGLIKKYRRNDLACPGDHLINPWDEQSLRHKAYELSIDRKPLRLNGIVWAEILVWSGFVGIWGVH